MVQRCPCGSPVPFDDCCGRALAGLTAPATAEALMRSRYSAFAVGDEPYLLRSWHPTTRPRALSLDTAQHWDRLEIVDTVGGGLLQADGIVEFRAHYRIGGRRAVLHRRSRFVRHEGRWVYLDGEVS